MWHSMDRQSRLHYDTRWVLSHCMIGSCHFHLVFGLVGGASGTQGEDQGHVGTNQCRQGIAPRPRGIPGAPSRYAGSRTLLCTAL